MYEDVDIYDFAFFSNPDTPRFSIAKYPPRLKREAGHNYRLFVLDTTEKRGAAALDFIKQVLERHNIRYIELDHDDVKHVVVFENRVADLLVFYVASVISIADVRDRFDVDEFEDIISKKNAVRYILFK
jgi:hypothetical protein